MDLNFKEALATLARALPLVFSRAVVFVAGGFMVILLFAMLLVASRFAGGSASAVIVAITVMALGGGWISGRVLERFFLYRQRASMLFMFSGCPAAAAGRSGVILEVFRFFPAYATWATLNRKLRGFLSGAYHGSAEFSFPLEARGGRLGGLTAGPLGQALLALAFVRGGGDAGQAAREALALFIRHGAASRELARRWLWFSAAGLAAIFLLLALPNYFFFSSAGAPLWLGMALAAAIAGLMHQAFIVPFVLAGVSAALLAATRGHSPDPELCDRLAALFPDAPQASGR
jgi:hypothetical protein